MSAEGAEPTCLPCKMPCWNGPRCFWHRHGACRFLHDDVAEAPPVGTSPFEEAVQPLLLELRAVRGILEKLLGRRDVREREDVVQVVAQEAAVFEAVAVDHPPAELGGAAASAPHPACSSPADAKDEPCGELSGPSRFQTMVFQTLGDGAATWCRTLCGYDGPDLGEPSTEKLRELIMEGKGTDWSEIVVRNGTLQLMLDDDYDVDMPLVHRLAKELVLRLVSERSGGLLWWLVPNGIVRAAVEFKRGVGGRFRPASIPKIVISMQHAGPGEAELGKGSAGAVGVLPSLEEMNELMEENVVMKTLSEIVLQSGKTAQSLIGDSTQLHIILSARALAAA